MLQNGGFKSAVDKFTESAVRQCESAGVELVIANVALYCREILARFLPHVAEDSAKTQILPFYSFAAVQRPISGAAMSAMPAVKQTASIAAENMFARSTAEAQ